MKQYRNIGIMLLAGAFLLVGFTGNALAWSAAACSTIDNRASLTFAVGGVDQGILESSQAGNSTLGAGNGGDTTFTVDSRVDLDVTLLSAQPLSATGTDQVLHFQVTNLGNDTQQYQLQLFAGVDATDDDFDMNNVRVYLDADNDGVLDLPGDTQLATDIGATGPAFGADLGLTGVVPGAVGANDNTISVFVVSNVPGGQANAATAAYALRAISYQADGTTISITDSVANGGTVANNSCSNPVVIGDDLETNIAVGGVTDAARDGAAYASGAYTVLAAGISVQKTQAVLWDPINLAATPQAIPGAYVQYQIIISNANGAASATLTQITDDLAAQLAFDADLNTAGPGTEENAVGDGFKVTHVSARTLGDPLYYTTSDGDTDGASITAGTITAIFADLLPAEAGYAAGELKAGESVTLIFNAVIQ